MDDRSVFEIVTRSPGETLAFGERLGRVLSGGLALGLVGPLGAGKTQFVKGLAAGNGWSESASVTSPTFTLVNEYPGRLHLFHIDVYRLKSPAELEAIGFHEMLRSDSIVVVEWADLVSSLMPEDAAWIEIVPRGESERAIRVRAAGSLSEQVLAEVAVGSD